MSQDEFIHDNPLSYTVCRSSEASVDSGKIRKSTTLSAMILRHLKLRAGSLKRLWFLDSHHILLFY